MTDARSTTLASRLAAFAATSRFETLPEPVVASVRDRVLDTLGIERRDDRRVWRQDGLLVEHLFPSDGEYTLTVTPIFGGAGYPETFTSTSRRGGKL